MRTDNEVMQNHCVNMYYYFIPLIHKLLNIFMYLLQMKLFKLGNFFIAMYYRMKDSGSNIEVRICIIQPN